MPKKIHRRPDADPQDGLEKYGDATFADPVNKKYPIDTPGRIKAAWAYIHQPINGPGLEPLNCLRAQHELLLGEPGL